MLNVLDKWQTYAVASAFFASLTALTGKVGVKEINSNAATFIRTVIILGLTALLLTGKREWPAWSGISGRSLLFLGLSGVATGFSWLCYYRALQLGPASRVAPVDKLSVIFVILFAALFLGEKLTLTSVLGASLIFAGSLVLVLNP